MAGDLRKYHQNTVIQTKWHAKNLFLGSVITYAQVVAGNSEPNLA